MVGHASEWIHFPFAVCSLQCNFHWPRLSVTATRSISFPISSLQCKFHWPRLDRSQFATRSISFPICSAISTDATRSISFRDSTDLISHFPFAVQFPVIATRFGHRSHFPFHDHSKSGVISIGINVASITKWKLCWTMLPTGNYASLCFLRKLCQLCQSIRRTTQLGVPTWQATAGFKTER